MDNVVTVELQAIAEDMIPLVGKSLALDKAFVDVSDGVIGAGLTLPSSLPHLGTPHSGPDVTFLSARCI